MLHIDRRSQQTSALARRLRVYYRSLTSVRKEPGPWTLMTLWCKLNECTTCSFYVFFIKESTKTNDLTCLIRFFFSPTQPASCVQLCRDPLLLNDRGNLREHTYDSCLHNEWGEIIGQLSEKKSIVWLIFSAVELEPLEWNVQKILEDAAKELILSVHAWTVLTDGSCKSPTCCSRAYHVQEWILCNGW